MPKQDKEGGTFPTFEPPTSGKPAFVFLPRFNQENFNHNPYKLLIGNLISLQRDIEGIFIERFRYFDKAFGAFAPIVRAISKAAI